MYWFKYNSLFSNKLTKVDLVLENLDFKILSLENNWTKKSDRSLWFVSTVVKSPAILSKFFKSL